MFAGLQAELVDGLADEVDGDGMDDGLIMA